MTAEDASRDSMVEGCRRTKGTGLDQGASGNLSARAGNGVLVAPTSPPYDAMQPGDIVRMTVGELHDGPSRPSSGWRVHRDMAHVGDGQALSGGGTAGTARPPRPAT